mmetsp:Transcript_12980/g.36572  ORF Transcript_12980/g.36572 Transcript_12980/m.36572 type:complete len:304 (+) Transcript_12980:117-1028(+)
MFGSYLRRGTYGMVNAVRQKKGHRAFPVSIWKVQGGNPYSSTRLFLRVFRRIELNLLGFSSSKFSICIGMFIRSSKPSNGVLLPSRILAIPNRMGYFKSKRYPLHSFSINRTTARAVSTPSATSLVDAKISSIVSPFPRRYPNFRFLDRGPKHVPNVSPTPDKPAIVLDFAPKVRPKRLISLQPLVTNPLMALVPSPSPSHMPAPRAMTFFTAPPISTPITSALVKHLNRPSLIRAARSRAKSKSSDAITTAVAPTPSTISRANDGPLKNAKGRSSPNTSRITSAMKPMLVVSIPLLTLKIGV